MSATFPPGNPGASARPLRLSKMDYLLMALMSLSMLTVCLVFSHQRLLWPDEEFGREILRDPSFLHMFVGWREGVDGGGVLYYIFCRLWIDFVGFSALTLRLFSTLGVITSLLITWVAARRYFSLFAVAFAASLIYLTSPCILWQDVNGRFYGMFLAATALACAVFLRTAEKDRASAADLFLFFLAHLLLIGTHILGVVYSAGLIVAAVAFDRLAHRWRPRLYLSGLAAWILLPISYRAIINTTSIAKRTFWATKPGLRRLVEGQLAFDHLVTYCVAALAACIVLGALLSRRRAPLTSRATLTGQTPLTARETPATWLAQQLRAHPWIFLIGGLALAQLVLFVKSRFGLSLYADRYLLPLQIGTVFVVTALLTSAWRLWPMVWPLRRLAPFAALCAVVLGFLYAVSTPSHSEIYPAAGAAQQLERLLPPNRDVITPSIGVFTVMRSYDTAHNYIFPIDWAYASEPAHALEDHQSERLMENWRRAGYAPGDLLDCNQVLTLAPDFTVLVDPLHDPWLKERFLDNPAFRAQQVGSSAAWGPVTIWNVHRVGNPAPCR